MNARPAVLSLLLAAALAGCNGPATPSAGQLPRTATVAAPRVVTLAPHLAELVFAVGAGDLLVGVSAYTDYPEAAAALPGVGDAFAVDQERLALLEPDLLLAWGSGTAAHVVDELRQQGYRVEIIETRGIDDVAAALLRIGQLTGHEAEAATAADDFRRAMRELAVQYRQAHPIEVFYQVSSRPLYTVNGDHYVSDLIEVCGGRNVFGDLDSLAPLVDVEAVLARDPEVMLASDDAEPDAFDAWRRWPTLAANRYGNYFRLPANEIGRATPRLVQAGRHLCQVLERARRNADPGPADPKLASRPGDCGSR